MLTYHFVTLVILLNFGDSGLFVTGISEMSAPQAAPGIMTSTDRIYSHFTV